MILIVNGVKFPIQKILFAGEKFPIVTLPNKKRQSLDEIFAPAMLRSGWTLLAGDENSPEAKEL